jgi:hypothetical protein
VALKPAGFFRELPHGSPDGPALRESVQRTPLPDENLLVRYLDSAAAIATTGSMVDDVLDPTKTDVALLEILTDGEWVWPHDLAYYVRQYHVPLPAEFVEHMRRHEWQPRAFTEAELEQVGDAYLAESA